MCAFFVAICSDSVPSRALYQNLCARIALRPWTRPHRGSCGMPRLRCAEGEGEALQHTATHRVVQDEATPMSSPRWLLMLPNILTWLRVLAVPGLVVLFFANKPFSTVGCSILFALAGITDALDGKLARHLRVESAFGAFLDPVADKLMVCTALVLLTSTSTSPHIAVASVLIVCREVFISALREWMASIGSRSKVAVGIQGKIKTVAQMVALTALLWNPTPNHGSPYLCGLVLLYISVFFTLTSAAGYVQAARSDISK
ncbi:CDP-diacylglycerol--glycerol-3-phosphate 3-phosphatidyltransferase [Porphyridium purpureum]|uniref:CDP-diacylglycerol--glycerol-3-phosphate 3-phosphatidyltransferase n=1 Tax=Porphyridium purpureum TaxID=35688 RepID=A0A5J4Z6G0_PORPP|nr:CDP-diacylglycerol--glycerol-3-phosphate 3-phosphatidyltransferase [Porphyridium purpureum]|eukprot:POR6018..scf295_1